MSFLTIRELAAMIAASVLLDHAEPCPFVGLS